MKFSIITCTKNSARFINENISSIRYQIFKDYEHVFIDGFSTDGTKEMILEYQKSNPTKIKFLQLEPKGIANAMNEGICEAQGEYIIHLHSDDYLYDKNVLRDVANFLEKNNCDWIYGKEMRRNTMDDTLVVTNCTKYSRYSSNTFLGKYILKFYFFIRHQTVFIKKNVFDRYGLFDESLKCPMDYEFFLRIREHTRWVFFNRIIDNFVIHDHNQSITQKNHLENIIEIAIVQLRYMNRFEYKLKYIFDFLINFKYFIVDITRALTSVKKEVYMRQNTIKVVKE